MPESPLISRRNFLKVAATITGGGLVLKYGTTRSEAIQHGLADPLAWVSLHDNGQVTLTICEAEMGQGVETTLSVLIAEELEVNWAQLRTRWAPLQPVFGKGKDRNHVTGASSSVALNWDRLRMVGAVTREILVTAAADLWQVAPRACHARNGRVYHPRSNRMIPYAALADRASRVKVPEFVRLKDPESWRLIGKSMPRLDTPAKSRCTAVFASDIDIPGMLVAQVVQCPFIGGSLVGFDSAEAGRVSGVEKIVSLTNGWRPAVAVVAEDFWSAQQGRAALEIEWSPGEEGDVDMDVIESRLENLLHTPGEVLFQKGDPARAYDEAPRQLEATYRLPYWAHAPMEPMACTAHVHDDRCEIWGPFQDRTLAATYAAEASGMPIESVDVHLTYLGGGFGRHLFPDYVLQAVELSKQIGAPIQVLWTREDDLQHGIYHPATHTRLRAGFDDKTLRVITQKVSGLTRKPVPLDVGLATMYYDIGAVQQEVIRGTSPSGLVVGNMRGVGISHNGFCRECFLDEIAQAMEKDPYLLRREMAGDHPRLIDVMDATAQRANWSDGLPSGRGRGFAANTLNLYMGPDTLSYIACVAVVSLAENRIVIDRITSVVDCGLAVDPHLVTAQVESGITYALTCYLRSEITPSTNGIPQNNFHNYPMVRMSEMPQLDILVQSRGDKPGPVGELAGPAVGAAVCNAIASASGTRVRDLPLEKHFRRRA